MKALRKGTVFLGAVILIAFIGGAIGFGYAILQIQGLRVPWSELPAPPETPVKIMMVDGDQVWIQTAGGALYLNSSSSDCQVNCWARVDTFPEQPVTPRYDDEYIKVTPGPCSTPPMLRNVMEVRGECESNGLYNLNTVYAIKTDGTMMLWKTETGGEWALVELVFITGYGMLLSLLVGIPLGIFGAVKQK
jgi:hypothetical protein